MRSDIHPQGFIPHRLTERPEGAPEIGETFEFSYAPSMNESRETIWIYRVIGWEKHETRDADQISVRVDPVDCRYRNMTGMARCDMGHWHPTFDGEPCKPGAPARWGFGGRDDN